MSILVSRLTNTGTLFTSGELVEYSSGLPSGSAFFNSSFSNYLETSPSSDYVFGSGDFTVEWFQYSLPGKPYARAFTLGGYPAQFGNSQEVSGGTTFYLWLGGSPVSAFTMDTYLNRWIWVAISRISGNICMFQDGKLMSVADSSAEMNDSTDLFTVGADPSQGPGAQFSGYITNFRFVNGVGLYTGSDIGTVYYPVPTSPLTATAETKLLLLETSSDTFLLDSSLTGREIFNVNGVVWDSNNPGLAGPSGFSISNGNVYADEFDETTSFSSIDNTSNIVVGENLFVSLDAGNISSYSGSGPTWVDLSGNGNNFTLINSPVFSDDDGGILIFDETSEQFGLGSDIGTISNYTLESWVKFNSYPASTMIMPSIITNTYGGGGLLNFNLGFDLINQGTITGGHFNNIDPFIGWYEPVGIVPDLNIWYHFTVTFDGSIIIFYVNGMEFSRISTDAPAISTGLGLRIGRRWDNPEYIDGDISIARIYNRALTPDEVSFNYSIQYPRYFNVVKRETSDGIMQISGEFDEITLNLPLDPTLIMYVDAGDIRSYPQNGETWFDLTTNGNDLSMTNPGDLIWNNNGYFSNSTSGFFERSGSSNTPIGNSPYCIGVWCREINPWPAGSGLIGIGGFGSTEQSNFLRTDTGQGGFKNYWWGNDLGSPTSFHSGDWLFALAQFDGSNRSIWVNGINFANDSPGSSHNVLLNNIYVGNTAYSGDQPNKGDIAIAFIYNRALSSDEIISIFDAQRGRFGV